MKFFTQTNALIHKNLLLYGLRRLPSTILRAIIIPIAFIILLAELKKVGSENGPFGINSSRSIKSLTSTFTPSKKLVIVTNNLGSLADNAAKLISDPLKSAGHDVITVQDPIKVQEECPATLGGKTNCMAAIVFNEAKQKSWNYTLRHEMSLGSSYSVDNGDNDVQTILLPIQAVIDSAIAKSSKLDSVASMIPNTLEKGFTSRTEQQRIDDQRIMYMQIITGFLAIAFLYAGLGVVYHLVGAIAAEREAGMSSLIEVSGCGTLPRVLSFHVGFSLIYIPGWIITAILTKTMIFTQTSFIVTYIGQMLGMLSITSLSCYGASLFRKAQISGILVSFVCAAGSILAMYFSTLDEGERLPLVIFSIVFPPANFLYYHIWLATFESANMAASLTSVGPPGFGQTHPHSISGAIMLLIALGHIIIFFVLAVLTEKWRFGTGDRRRVRGTQPGNMIELEGFCKTYKAKSRCFCCCSKRSKDVKAVKGLSLSVRAGEIMCLLGANGSGKSTTLEAITGLGCITSGKIRLKEGESVGFCPQKNVLWDDLTCSEHVRIFNRIRGCNDNYGVLHSLIRDCDLAKKTFAASKTLSGGQKRKLQLACMLTGDTRVCSIDEVSSGVDPLSRRRLHEIILSVRGKRTIILTTHHLEESDLLSDRIAIMSKGELKAYGSCAELKTRLGGGYKVHAGSEIYNVDTAENASRAAEELQHSGMEVSIMGPTLEEVFLKVADDAAAAEQFEEKGMKTKKSKRRTKKDKQYEAGFAALTEQDLQGRKVSAPSQILVMFRKRWTILRRSSKFATAVMCLIPILAAFITTSQLSDYKVSSCALPDQRSSSYASPVYLYNLNKKASVVVGPKSAINGNAAQNKLLTLLNRGRDKDDQLDKSKIEYITVESVSEFESYISNHQGNVTNGFFIDPSKKKNLIAYEGGWDHASESFNALNNLLLPSDTSISMYESGFDTPGDQSLGNSLLFIMYFGLAIAIYPAFFALYPTVERLRNVRALHYSNGIRALPLWCGYILYDLVWIVIITTIVMLFLSLSTNWNNMPAIGFIFILYGLVSAALSYILSMKLAKSQLAAFAIIALFQIVGLIVVVTVFITVSLDASIGNVNASADKAHYIMALFFPIASVVRSLFIGLNTQAMACTEGSKAIPNFLSFRLYGGCILYLLFQLIILLSWVITIESDATRSIPIPNPLKYLRKNGRKAAMYHKGFKDLESESAELIDRDVAAEAARVIASTNGLRVQNLQKTFGSNTAVSNVTFGVRSGECLALLGPNGAGKTTTMNMIRGILKPDGGSIHVENVDVNRHTASARAHLGVVAQVDCCDSMTVEEHFIFYARARGVRNVMGNVEHVIRAVGLSPFRERLAAKLSGGNKRKLALGIALMGNPSVLLLDEPSSGMDAASKRVMWKTIASVAPGRSILLTTHSLEEAHFLASRHGILARKMLAIGTTEHLREKVGNRYHIQAILQSAPQSSQDEMARLVEWVSETFHGVMIETTGQLSGGQLRFSVPAVRGSVSDLMKGLLRGKDEVGLEYFSVAQTGLEDMFLSIVTKNNVEEENSSESRLKWWKFW